MIPVELTKIDDELIIVNFEAVRSFYADKGDDSTGGTIIRFMNGDDLTVKEPFTDIRKVFKIAEVKMQKERTIEEQGER